VVLHPDRVLLERAVFVELEMVVVVVGIFVMLVHDVLAEEMVGKIMSGLLVLGFSHQFALPYGSVTVGAPPAAKSLRGLPGRTQAQRSCAAVPVSEQASPHGATNSRFSIGHTPLPA
jgi:hypothetical protein